MSWTLIPTVRRAQLRAPIALLPRRRPRASTQASIINMMSTRSDKPPLKKRSVVSSFLYKFVDENGERRPKVALFKRSGQVRTYP